MLASFWENCSVHAHEDKKGWKKGEERRERKGTGREAVPASLSLPPLLPFDEK